MGGASDSPLETVEDRNGLVSGGKPWNRGVLWSGAESAVRQRTTREVPTAPERLRDGVERLAERPDASRSFPCPLPRTSVRHRSATASRRRLRTEQRARRGRTDRLAGRSTGGAARGYFGHPALRSVEWMSASADGSLIAEKQRTFATAGAPRCPGEARATASAARERWETHLFGGGFTRAVGFGPRSVRASPPSLRR